MNELPCEGKGWSYPVSHCAPPVGHNEKGYNCGVDKCPLYRLATGQFGEAHAEELNTG